MIQPESVRDAVGEIKNWLRRPRETDPALMRPGVPNSVAEAVMDPNQDLDYTGYPIPGKLLRQLLVATEGHWLD